MNTGNAEADKERLTCYGEDKEDHTGASTSLAQIFPECVWTGQET